MDSEAAEVDATDFLVLLIPEPESEGPFGNLAVEKKAQRQVFNQSKKYCQRQTEHPMF